MRERAILLAAFLLLGGWHWSRLEQPSVSAGALLALSLLAAAPALVAVLVRRLLPALAALVVSLVVAAGAVSGYWPWERGHPFFLRRLWDVVARGVRDWFSTRTPFDPGRFHAVDVDVRLGFYALALVLAYLVLARGRRGQPLLAVAVAFALVALPSTVVGVDQPMLRAGLFLALALALLWVSGEGVPRSAARLQFAALTLLVCVAAVVVGQAPGVTKSAFFDWQRWNPVADAGPSVSVNYVWNQDYAPLHWPHKKTEVFEVTSPRPYYWRAAILDEFVDDHWQADPQVAQYGASESDLGVPTDLLPALASKRKATDVQVRFHITGLADTHLLTAEGQPLEYQIPSGVRPTLDTDGTVSLDRDVARGQDYSVRAYVPDPTGKQLASADDHFPASVADGVQVEGRLLPVWGSTAARATAAGAITLPAPLPSDYMAASDRTWRASKADEAGSEYAAVIAVEGYLRSSAFHYDQTPHYSGKVPPLVEFLTTSHRGYCQMFSGAMALVLRLHGIPARIAVGFTSGTQSGAGQPFKVTDHDAHSWVEVYFPGYGWLPFDPTISRHLPMQFSTSNPKLGTTSAADLVALLPTNSPTARALKDRSSKQQISKGHNLPHHSTVGAGRRGTGDRGKAGAAPRSGGHRASVVLWLLAAAAAVAALVAAVKLAAVRWRYLRRDPRSRAEAAYRELLTFVADQGLTVTPGTTVGDLSEQVKRVFSVDMSAFAAAATAARYAPPEQAADAARGLGGELRRVKREVRGQLSLWERLSGLFRLRAAFTHPATA